MFKVEGLDFHNFGGPMIRVILQIGVYNGVCSCMETTKFLGVYKGFRAQCLRFRVQGSSLCFRGSGSRFRV